MDRINLDRLTEVEKIFHCALLKKKIYLPKRSFMIVPIISLILIRSMTVILKHNEDVTNKAVTTFDSLALPLPLHRISTYLYSTLFTLAI